MDDEKYPFPVRVVSRGGEILESNHNNKGYDTLISINVVEHVQDAFQYLTQLYLAIKPGGILIYHDRYYGDSENSNDVGVMQGDKYHPIRIRQAVLNHFLSGFKILYNNCNAKYNGRKGEQGYYVIARKL